MSFKIQENVQVQSKVEEEAQVIVHCSFTSKSELMGIRIWESTVLVDKESNHRATLMHIENISMQPDWTWVLPNKTYRFALIFSALPKSCSHFDLFEDIPQPGGFLVPNIERNRTDVYRVKLD
ncbi:MAG: hypothetical protein ACI8ZN_002742 [Bacteroidia bacterium]|jgi:hypothetical protein